VLVAPANTQASAPITDATMKKGLLLRTALLQNSTEQKAKLMVEHFAAAIVWVTLENSPLEFRRHQKSSQGVFCEIDLLDHVLIERLPAGRSVSRKYDAVR
jgi:hypothetical protein